MKIFDKTNKGFTLTELLIVTVILALLALIAIPLFTGGREKAHNMRAIAPLDASASTLMSKRSVLTNDWSTDELDSSEKLTTILTNAEPAFTFTKATGEGEPDNTGSDVVVRRIGTITVSLRTKSDSGDYFCVLIYADVEMSRSRSVAADTCDGDTNGWGSSAIPNRIAVCHKKGSDFMLLNVQNNALPAHEAHGDVQPPPIPEDPDGGCPAL